jgi:hypothetical protein
VLSISLMMVSIGLFIWISSIGMPVIDGLTVPKPYHVRLGQGEPPLDGSP